MVFELVVFFQKGFCSTKYFGEVYFRGCPKYTGVPCQKDGEIEEAHANPSPHGLGRHNVIVKIYHLITESRL